MADGTTIKQDHNSPEEVAYKLFQDVLNVEKRALYAHGDNPADRKLILDTYAECLLAVKSPHDRQ
ncbi:hypothetical protein [Hyphobacterium sp.]|uniref:hypothetical protein n=1 Tax=Hyphobacterium sp. TaxID=2004662 RepID=UPI003B5194FA